MNNSEKTKEQLLIEIERLNKKIDRLEQVKQKDEPAQKITDALELISAQIPSAKGHNFFHLTCKHLSRALGIDYAFIGEIHPDKQSVNVIAGYGKSKALEPFPYFIKNTPCQGLLNESLCSYPTNIQQLFPDDALLKELNIDGYLGIPLVNRSGEVLGIMVLLHSRPIENIDFCTALLQIISERVSAELERNDVEKELRVSEELFLKIFQTNPNILTISTLNEGRMRLINEAGVQAIGLSKDKIINSSSKELGLIDDKSRSKLKTAIQKQGYFSGIELPISLPNGTSRTCLFNGHIIKFENQNCLFQTIIDITEQKKSQELLNKLNLAVQHSREIIFMTDKEGLFTFVNEQFSAMYGYSSEEVVGTQTPRILKSERISEKDYTEFWEALLNKESVKKEYLNRCKNGELIDIEASADPILNEQGDIIGFLAIQRDISKKLKAQEELKSREEKLKAAQKVAKLGHFSYAIQIDQWTSSIELDNIFGFDKASQRNVNGWLQTVHPEFRTELSQFINYNILQAHEKFDKEFKIVNKKTGKEHWIHGLGNLKFDEQNRPIEMFGTMQDITKKKQAENVLKETQKQLINAQKIAKLGYFRFNIPGDSWTCSTELDIIFGIDDSYTKNIEGWLHLVHPADRNDVIKQFTDQPLNDGDFFRNEYRIINQTTGHEKWILGIGQLEIDDNNVPLGMFGTIQDISERKQREELLTQRESLLQAIFHSTGSGLLVVNTKGEVTHKNEFFMKMWNFPKELMNETNENRLLEHAVSQLNNPIQFASDVNKLNNSLQTDYQIIRFKDGRVFERNSNPLIIDNKTQGRVWGFKEITERVQAEKKLKESEDRFKSLFENLGDAVYVTHLGGEDNGKILEVNAAATTQTGYTREELLKMNIINDLTVGEISNHSETIFEKQLLNGEILTLTEQKKGKNGSAFWTEVIVTPFDFKGQTACLSINRNINKRRLAEEKLRKNEQRMRLHVNQTLLGVVEWNLDFTVKDWNPAAEKIFGYSKQEAINKHARFFLPKHTWQHIDKIWNQLLLQKGGAFSTNENLNKKGEIISCEWYNTPLVDENGKIIAVSSLIENVTARKEAEKLLFESEEKYRLLVENQTDLVVKVDTKGKFQYLSHSYCELFGTREEELLGKDFFSLLYKDDQENSRKLFNRLMYPPHSAYTEQRSLTKKGWKWLGWMDTAILDEKGKISAVIKVGRDITERIQAEQLQKALYNISTAVIKTDNLNKLIQQIRNELAPVIDTNNFHVALYNANAKEINVPFFVNEKLPKSSVTKGKTLTRFVIESQKSLLVTKAELHALRKTKKIVPFDVDPEIWLGVPLKVDSEIIGVIAVQSFSKEKTYNESDLKMLEFVSDQISFSIHKKRAEENLVMALEKATESDRLKSAFLATMSHELRTPLNAIIGFSEFFNKNIPPENAMKFGKIIHTSGNHLLSIVNDLFEITLIESGEIKIRIEDVAVENVLTDVYSLIESEKQRANKDKLELNLIIPPEKEKINIKTDPNKLKQILINLLKNAVKFTNKGHVNYGFTITTKHEKLFLKFFVQDTGIGIPAEQHDMIFDVFRQAQESSSRKYAGTGIGLSVAKRLTELLGGEIWLESKVGKGSGFYFTLPLGEHTNIQSANLTTVNKKTGNNRLILIVEDDDVSFEFLQIVLSANKIPSIRARNGEEAVNTCKANKNISLILMDINMPVMDGYTATKLIKEFNPNLPIIIQTAYAIAGDHQKAIDAGCDDYISKPIKQNILLEKIELLITNTGAIKE